MYQSHSVETVGLVEEPLCLRVEEPPAHVARPPLNNGQQQFMHAAVKAGEPGNVPRTLLIAPPGTGKTFVTAEAIRYYVQQGYKVQILAMTLKALDALGTAVNQALQNHGLVQKSVQLRTIASFLALGPTNLDKNGNPRVFDTVAQINTAVSTFRRTNRRLRPFSKTVFVLEEVNLILPNYLAVLSGFLNIVQTKERGWFGDVILFANGDPNQMHPDEGAGLSYFVSNAHHKYVLVMLTQVMRQTDEFFQAFLEAARTGVFSPAQVHWMEQRRLDRFSQVPANAIFITSNAAKRETLQVNAAKTNNQVYVPKIIKSTTVARKTLTRLRVGSRVQLLVNYKSLVRGMRGRVVQFGHNGRPHVQFASGVYEIGYAVIDTLSNARTILNRQHAIPLALDEARCIQGIQGETIADVPVVLHHTLAKGAFLTAASRAVHPDQLFFLEEDLGYDPATGTLRICRVDDTVPVLIENLRLNGIVYQH